MKLYLSSQKLGNETQKLISLCGTNKNIAVIANGLDDMPDVYRQERVKTEIESLMTLGFSAEELDLREYFNKPKELQGFLVDKSMVRVRGGSAFILNRAMIESQFNIIGVEMIKKSDLVYAGYSAALIVATTNLAGTELVDNPLIIPNGYSKDVNPFFGLGLIDFYLIPHIDSKEPWAINIPQCVKKLIENNMKVITLKDGETYIVDE